MLVPFLNSLVLARPKLTAVPVVLAKEVPNATCLEPVLQLAGVKREA